jgi:hypothetical protein
LYIEGAVGFGDAGLAEHALVVGPCYLRLR